MLYDGFFWERKRYLCLFEKLSPLVEFPSKNNDGKEFQIKSVID